MNPLPGPTRGQSGLRTSRGGQLDSMAPRRADPTAHYYDNNYPADFRTGTFPESERKRPWEPVATEPRAVQISGSHRHKDADDSPSASEEEEAEPPCVSWRSLIVGIGLTLLALACWLGVMSHSGGRRHGGSPVAPPVSPTVKPAVKNLVDPTHAARSVVLTTPAPSPPSPNLHDGNVCKDNEEHFAGLCYKKCSIMTDNKNTIRTSPWTCCERRPCFVNQRLHIGLRVACVGFAVSGDGKCPHMPGACLDNEETMLGVCYKKCSMLTNKNYPYRVGPATCCKTDGLSCLYFWKTYTSKEFDVGGGRKGDGACFEDEEMLLGTCYKKCNLLTDGSHPHRLGPFTCCGARQKFPHIEGGVWHLGCLDLRKMQSRPNFAINGNRTEVEYDRAHLPLKHLTEVEGNSSNNMLLQV
mmetsp:Transcript_38782/g.76864  ORF Transcript_38782/g.76864 Transcript_38782/m.76864 type:complete len:412 (+) Transcript_38782:9-1244(+)